MALKVKTPYKYTSFSVKTLQMMNPVDEDRTCTCLLYFNNHASVTKHLPDLFIDLKLI